MSGELDAAGAAITAGLAAAAIEGDAKGRGPHPARCANCDAQLTGAFCATCGQSAHVHRSLTHILEEALHGIVHFDAKAWRTLPMLAFRPGGLTRAYVMGKRARYISPLAMFLFCVFLMFFVFAFTGGAIIGVNQTPPTPERASEARARIEAVRGDLETARAEAERQGAPIAARALEAGEAMAARADAAAARAAQDQSGVRADVTIGGDGVTVSENASGGRWQDELRAAVERGDITVNLGNEALNKRVLKKLENPDLALYAIQQTAYKFSFLLVPISLPFMWLLFFWKRGVTLYDHTVFVLYSLSFMSLLLVCGVLIERTGLDLGGAGALTGPLAAGAHMFFQLKGAYALSWFSALWRIVFLLMFALISLGVFLVSIVLLGLTG
ncbi:MAG: DUF3667 domain-containing protein [Hyphomonadaceae bacterium]|nr:DUF3667 domain-containing protein [Hyphomonadaceae bacterium]